MTEKHDAHLIYEDMKYKDAHWRLPEKLPALESQKNLKSLVIRRVLKKLRGRSLDYLDAGCGWGSFVFLVSPHVQSAWGTDISPSSIAMAQEVAKTLARPNCHFFIHDMGCALDKTLSFDFITCFDVLEHLLDPGRTVEHLLARLEPDGVCVFTTGFRYRFSLRTVRYWFADAGDRERLSSWLAELRTKYGLERKGELTVADAYAYHLHNFREEFFRKIAAQHDCSVSFLYKPAILSEIWDWSRFSIKSLLKGKKATFAVSEKDRKEQTVQLWAANQTGWKRLKEEFQFALARIDAFCLGPIVKGPGGFIFFEKRTRSKAERADL